MWRILLSSANLCQHWPVLVELLWSQQLIGQWEHMQLLSSWRNMSYIGYFTLPYTLSLYGVLPYWYLKLVHYFHHDEIFVLVFYYNLFSFLNHELKIFHFCLFCVQRQLFDRGWVRAGLVNLKTLKFLMSGNISLRFKK